MEGRRREGEVIADNGKWKTLSTSAWDTCFMMSDIETEGRGSLSANDEKSSFSGLINPYSRRQIVTDEREKGVTYD